MMTSRALSKNGRNPLFPSIRLVSLNTGQRTETPLGALDPPIPLCTPDPPICIAELSLPRCYTVSCTCDCVGDCACDLYVKPPCHCDPCDHCYCVSKSGYSPDTDMPPESCEAHARTFFRLARDDD